MSTEPFPSGPTATAGTATGTPVRNNLHAIAWAFASVVAASTMVVAVRAASSDLSPVMIVTLRFCGTLLFLLLALVFMARLRAGIQFTRPSIHILRGLGFFGSTHLGFYAIAHLELVTVTVLFFTAPIFAAVLSALFAGERIGPRRVAAILAGFCGVLVVLRPDTGAIDLATFAAIGSSLMFAATLILSRQLSDADGSMSVLFSSVGLTAILSVPLAVPVAEMPGSMIVWGMIGILIAAGAVRSFADIRAYSVGDAAVIAPIIYIRLILIGAAGYVFFDEVPDATALVGAAIIIGAALFIANREAAARRRQARTGSEPEV